MRKYLATPFKFSSLDYNCRILSIHNITVLDATCNTYLAINDDPQIVFVPEKLALLKRSDLWLSFYFDMDNCKQPMELFFDAGEGFQQDSSLSFKPRKGYQQIYLPIPKKCKRLRIDPVSAQGHFSLSELKLSLNKHDDYPECFVDSVRDSNDNQVLQLEPMHETHVINATTNHYLSTGEDPYFQLDNSVIRKGWYMVSLKIKIENQTKRQFCAKFYLDTGQGFNEENSETLPYFSGQLVKRLVYLPEGVCKVRFDPLESKTEFSIQVLEFKKLFLGAHRKFINKKLKAFDRSPSGSITERYETYKQYFVPKTHQIDYQAWIEDIEKAELPSKDYIESSIQEFSFSPVFSVILPTYNGKVEHLEACLDSVLGQSYPFWELCIADDASTDHQVRDVLTAYAKKDDRIKLIFREQNGNISAASNSALSLAQGDFIVLLDHDDLLATHALYYVAEAISQQPLVNIIYSDEDKVDESGERFEPHFKSDWNPDLLYSQNYISHLGVYRKTLVDEVGGFREGFEGSQDYDLLLRVSAACSQEHIIHIPRVLYHWRVTEGSTALDASEKSYTVDAGIKALKDYFKSQNIRVAVDKGNRDNTYKIDWLLKEEPSVALIIPTRNGLDVTRQAIESILNKTIYPNYHIYLVDNNSDDTEALAWFDSISEHDKVTLLRYPHPFNYSAINNFAVSQTDAEIVGLINNDIEVINDAWLTEMVRHAKRKDIGCVGAKLYYPDDRIQHAGVIVGLGGVAGHSHKYYAKDQSGYFHRLQIVQNLSAVTAACLLVRREVFKEAKGLDAENLKVAFNDVDFCLKVRELGYRNLWTPYAELYHHESISRGAEDTPKKQARAKQEADFMKQKWGESLLSDPCYNKNLTLAREDFSIGQR